MLKLKEYAHLQKWGGEGLGAALRPSPRSPAVKGVVELKPTKEGASRGDGTTPEAWDGSAVETSAAQRHRCPRGHWGKAQEGPAEEIRVLDGFAVGPLVGTEA